MVWINIDRNKKETITRQLYDGLTYKILKGRIPSGYQLPPTRKMSQRLGISRNIVIEVYEQLKTEGYLVSKEGSGTFVAQGINVSSLTKPQIAKSKFLSLQKNTKSETIHFDATMPDMEHFPKSKWASLIRQAYMIAPYDYYGYPDVQGIFELRLAVAKHLKSYKGLECSSSQVVITLGSIQAFDIIYNLVKKDINTVAVEDPGYIGIDGFYNLKNLNMLYMSVDKSGMVVEDLPEDEIPKLICITPSNQYPTGSILSIQRRIKLLEYANKTQSYIIENDYGGDYNYLDIPMRSCHSINSDAVFHVGTFSKSLYPSLRIGYLVIPRKFKDAYNEIKNSQNLGLPAINQYALSIFIEEKYYIRHLNKMNKIYNKKRQLLTSELVKSFGQDIAILPSGSDYYIVVSFNQKYSVQKAYDKRDDFSIDFQLVENMAKKKGLHTREVLLGYGALSEEKIVRGVDRLKRLFNGI